MKISIAQTKPVRGDIASNMAQHKMLIEMAVSEGTDVTVFPELSLTGYEPSRAKDLVISLEDETLEGFQRWSDEYMMFIAVGAPVICQDGACIGMIMFRPKEARLLYSKQYLHADEEAFFVAKKSSSKVVYNGLKMGMAICYELSVKEHTQEVFRSGVDLYVASVAKTERSVTSAGERLEAIASDNKVPVLMSNCVGMSEDGMCSGGSSIWRPDGTLVGQLNERDQGILVYDMDQQTCKSLYTR